MVSDILTPMNHREIEYEAKRLLGCDIPGSLLCVDALLDWLDETGKRVFDDDLVMDYGTDCLRLYLLFEKTPRENDAPYYDSWNEGALEGLYKFLGRYRRMILAADEWNRRGKYNDTETVLPAADEWNRRGNYNDTETVLPAADVEKMKSGIKLIETALGETKEAVEKCIRRENTMQNRHHIVSALMKLLNVYQKELKTGEVVTALHNHAVEAAVPYGEIEYYKEIVQNRTDRRNPDVTRLCQEYMMLVAPFAPDLSKMLWAAVVSADMSSA